MVAHTIFRARHERGYILVTSLIFMFILAFIALVAMQSTTLEVKMTTGTIAKMHATETSEALRELMSKELLDAHIYYRDWPVSIGGGTADDAFNVRLPAGLSIADKDSDSAPDPFYVTNDAGELLADPATLLTDAELLSDGNNDGDHTDDVDMTGELAVYKTVTVNAPGASAAMVSGYEGTGKASAGGGAHLYFELRSVGTFADSARSITHADYRYVIRN